jgi:DNA-binding NtrC family response regulator
MASCDLAQTLADVEREHVLQVVAHCAGNRTHAAKRLDISVRGLRIKLNSYAHAGFSIPGHDKTGSR